MDEVAINQCLRHYKTYLNGYVELYKEAPVMPNNHLCLHISKFLRLFGSVHFWRSWVFERFNYLLQHLDTNTHFGGPQILTSSMSQLTNQSQVSLNRPS